MCIMNDSRHINHTLLLQEHSVCVVTVFPTLCVTVLHVLPPVKEINEQKSGACISYICIK